MKISLPKSCENAPRKKIVADFTLDLLKQEQNTISEYADLNIVLHFLHEKKTISGLPNLLESLKAERENQIREVTVEHVITHGNTAAINGQIFFAEGGRLEFCDVYRFASTVKTAKVKEIKCYWIFQKC
ncbi:hypothetical protein ACSMFR_02655 [Listeria aquatica]|uniref:hypothetical protein n=1 Tax=Listeria aquatica TaxID=1494960 RepID=UPI003F70BF20